MKFITIFGAGLLAFSGSFALSNNIFAAESTETTTTAESAQTETAQEEAVQTETVKPTRAELRSAITHLENLDNYHTYSLLSADELATTTKFFHEYTYLFKVANLAKDLDANYANASAEDLTDVIKLAEDAVIACRLIFGSTSQNSNAQHPIPQGSTAVSTPAQTPVVSAPTKPATSIITTTNQSQASTPTVLAQSTPIDIQPDNPTLTTSEAENNDIAVPTTGEVRGSNKPLFITLGVVAFACLLVGSMIILNRKKPYRPGRKF